MASIHDRRGMRSAFIIESTNKCSPDWRYWYEMNTISFLPPCGRYPWRVMDAHGNLVALYLPEIHKAPKIIPPYARCDPSVTVGIPVTPAYNQIIYLNPLEDV